MVRIRVCFKGGKIVRGKVQDKEKLSNENIIRFFLGHLDEGNKWELINDGETRKEIMRWQMCETIANKRFEKSKKDALKETLGNYGARILSPVRLPKDYFLPMPIDNLYQQKKPKTQYRVDKMSAAVIFEDGEILYIDENVVEFIPVSNYEGPKK